MNLLMNLLWLLLGGILVCAEYVAASIVLAITIVGIPFALQTLKIGMLALMPFGKNVESTPDRGGCLSLTMNILWIACGGVWISLSHLVLGLLLCITLVGIPFGIQHFKLAALALTPFGKRIV